MNRILIILPMVFAVAYCGAIMQPVELGPASQKNSALGAPSGGVVGSQPVQPHTAASSPEGAVVPASQFYYPTYPEYDPGYSVQTGYEGYLVPASQPAVPASPATWRSALWSVMSPVSRFALTYGARSGVYLLNLMLLLVVGGLFTTSVCTFTPLCTITILGLGKAQVKEQVTELARTYMTPERISAATNLVKRAIEKYATMQTEPIKEEPTKTEEESS